MNTTITTNTSSSITAPNLKKHIFFHNLHITTNFIRQFPKKTPPCNHNIFRKPIRCSSGNASGGGGGSLKDLLSGMVDERVELLLNKEENKDLLDGLEQASKRVELAKRELVEIERQEIEAKMMRDYINKLESRASEIEECQKEILEARTMIEEAERSLTENTPNSFIGSLNIDNERLESVKAALVAAVVGSLAQLPITFTRVDTVSELVLPLAITIVSCVLFGVTFRYAVRRDLDNIHLKSGTCAAFGFVKGLGMLSSGGSFELDASSISKLALDGAGYVSESLLIFFFAGVALDFCMKSRILSPFPIDDGSIPKE